MIILLIIITIALITLGCISNFFYETDSEVFGAALVFFLIAEIIALCICSNKLVRYRVIDDKIKLYQNQNKEIEQKIELVVKEYKDFEKDTFTGLKSDSYITLINLYPELKSDKMVQQQIDLYTKNNKKITSLKEEKINRTIYRWWVYFGK